MADLQHAPINISALGTSVVITGVAGKRIQVYGLFFQCSILTNVTVKSGTTALTGPMSFLAGGGLNLNPFSDVYFEVAEGENFVFQLAGLTGQVGGMVTYVQFDV